MSKSKQQKIEKQLRIIQLKESIKSQCLSSIEEKINRYLEVKHQGIIGGHYFSKASSECIYLYRDGYFIGAVMMSHAINEGIIKFIAERNSIKKREHTELINEFLEKRIISNGCAKASSRIWKSYRNDIHHMNPKVAKIPFKKLAQQNLKDLAIIEKEVFGFDVNNGTIVPHQPKYWDIDHNKTTKAFLRLE
ncbi:MAG: hypothetical protein ACKKMW_01210 [Candidatus Nealsonbacteria bacterium]